MIINDISKWQLDWTQNICKFSAGKRIKFICLNVLANHLLEQFILNDTRVSYGTLLCYEQKDLDPTAKDYSYIEYFQKSIMNAPDSTHKDVV